MLYRESGIASDSPHGERIDRIVAGNGHNALTIAHHDVLSLAHDPETRLLECAHSGEMIDAGKLGQN